MNIKSAAQIARKWARVTPERTQDFEDGVRNPSKDWKTETLAAQDRYEDGIKDSITRKAFGKGVERVGTAKQQGKSITKGIDRWPEGVRDAEKDMEEGMKPVVETLSNLTLPPRYKTGDPRNLKRVEAVAIALHKMRINR